MMLSRQHWPRNIYHQCEMVSNFKLVHHHHSIWFVGMTLYQRIYASKGEKEAKKRPG
jgi:hypothetical protein